MVEMALAFQQRRHADLPPEARHAASTPIARIVALAREALGADARLRVDYNQAYTPDEAVRAIEAIAPFGIDCAEQPVRADDWLGMARVQRAVAVPLMAHEGCFSLTDFTALLELGAVGVLGVNTERPGRHHAGAARHRLRRAARHRHGAAQPAARHRLGGAGADRRGARVACSVTRWSSSAT